MPVPNSTKEIKQFLGLTGYYRKFVPRFADISRPLTTLTKKEAKFEWTSACQKSFELLKEALCGEPVLKYACGEGTWQQCGNSRLQRQHLNGTCHRCEEDYTDGTGC